MTDASQLFHELADREAIRECLYRYSRAIDRREEALLRTVYWPDGYDNHGFFEGDVDTFIAWAFAALEPIQQSMHSLTNILINIDLPHAQTETYFVAYHRIAAPSGELVDMTLGGRFLDSMEKRGDEWRIARRDTAIDWLSEAPDSGDWAAWLPGVPRKTHVAPDDLSCGLFAGTRFDTR